MSVSRTLIEQGLYRTHTGVFEVTCQPPGARSAIWRSLGRVSEEDARRMNAAFREAVKSGQIPGSLVPPKPPKPKPEPAPVAVAPRPKRRKPVLSESEQYMAFVNQYGECPIEAGVFARLADNECRHDRLPTDKTPPCGCWPQEGALVIPLPALNGKVPLDADAADQLADRLREAAARAREMAA